MSKVWLVTGSASGLGSRLTMRTIAVYLARDAFVIWVIASSCQTGKDV
jgi:hypothetical protein